MFLLLLQRIQNTSESAISHVVSKVSKLKINKLKGEDVDTAVSLIRSTYKVLVSVLTSHRSFAPDDFDQTVLKVMQTSSVRDFNVVFNDEEQLALRKADKCGGSPVFPTIFQILNLATKTHQRLQLEDKWVLSAVHPALSAVPSTFSSSGGPRFTCWNGCKGEDAYHPYTKCPRELDHELIARNKKAYFDAKRARTGSSSGAPAPSAVAHTVKQLKMANL